MLKLDRAGMALSDWFGGVAALAELARGSTVRPAVTGWSRSGKTVLITSLVQNLLSALHQPHRMPLLRAVGDGRLLGARVQRGKTGRLPHFPYRRNIERMAATPADWPARTTDISEIEVDIRFVPAGALGFLLGRVSGGAATLKLKIVDYPGEWLLDPPPLTPNYADWSRATLELCRRGVRAEIGRDFLAYLSDHRADAAATDEEARRAHELYRRMLLTARNQHDLSFLPTGRFLQPASLGGESQLQFASLAIT